MNFTAAPFERFLARHGLAISLVLALFLGSLLACRIIVGQVIPIADGLGYALRVYALYGYLHGGHWNDFWTLLTHPIQSVLPLHALPFMLLPRSLAGTAAYVFLQQATTGVLLAWGINDLCHVLKRPAWAPTVFLLCAANNIAFIDFYDYFLDLQFCALGVLVIAWQIRSWHEPRLGWRAGGALGLLFFVKPANAVIFFAAYVLTETIRAGLAVAGKGSARPRWPDALEASRVALGFIPVAAAAFACGAGESILRLVDQNELHEQISPVACGGLLRLFYMPLCFAVCYHVTLLGGLILAALLARKWVAPGEEANGFPVRLFLPVAIAYLVLGEFFSFVMLVKTVRAMLIFLPLFWTALAWAAGKRRNSAPLFFAVAVVYASVALAQKSLDLLGTRDHLVEDTYQLSASSWGEMPSPWHRAGSLNQAICDAISRDLPLSGAICVNALEVRNALAWHLRSAAFLRGQTPPYEIRSLFDFRGDYDDHALVGACRVALVTFLPVQSSRQGWAYSMGVLDYGNQVWAGPSGRAQVIPLPAVGGEPVGYQFLLNPPLTQAEVDQANAQSPFIGMRRTMPDAEAASLLGRHYSTAEAWQILTAWAHKRLE